MLSWQKLEHKINLTLCKISALNTPKELHFLVAKNGQTRATGFGGVVETVLRILGGDLVNLMGGHQRTALHLLTIPLNHGSTQAACHLNLASFVNMT